RSEDHSGRQGGDCPWGDVRSDSPRDAQTNRGGGENANGVQLPGPRGNVGRPLVLSGVLHGRADADGARHSDIVRGPGRAVQGSDGAQANGTPQPPASPSSSSFRARAKVGGEPPLVEGRATSDRRPRQDLSKRPEAPAS